MNKITILVNTILNFEFKNFMLLSNSLYNNGKFTVYLGLAESLMICDGVVKCKVWKLRKEIAEDDSLSIDDFNLESLESINYVWVLSFGRRQTFLDLMQILWLLEKRTKVFNSVESLMFLNNKHWLGQYMTFKHPETYVSSDSDYLINLYDENNEDIWIIKPPAGSMGNGVFKIKPNDCNARSLIQLMSDQKSGKYAIFQKNVSEIKNGEKRVLVVNDRVNCFYLRSPPINGDFRTNIHQGAESEICELTQKEMELCREVGKEFARHGAYFIGIDLVYPYIIEVNVLNPGGLNTVWKLTGEDYSHVVIDEIFRNL